MHPDFAHIGDPATNLIEECAELIKSLAKFQRFGVGSPPYDNSAKIASEIEDVRRRIADWEGRPTATDAQGVGEARDWIAVESAIDSYIEDYEMLGEAEDGRDASYTPNENDRALLKDAMVGLLSDDAFMAAFDHPTASTTAGLTEAARDVITARDNYGWSTEVDEKIEALRARIAARAEPRVSTSGYLQTVSPSPPTTLHWDDTPAAADGPTDKRITELWNFSTGGSFVPEDTKAFARAVWDAAIADQAHLLAAGAEQESRYATMIGEISDALGFTETEQFEAEGADKILASIAALRATAAVPAADHAWRVGEFVSSARPPERVLMLAVGRRQIGEYGMHGDFVRWIATSASAPQVDKSADLHGGPVDEIAETHGEVVYAEFAGAPTVAEGSWGWACARDSGSRCKTHCGLAMCMQADQSGLSPADAAMKPSYGIDGPHDGTDHHQIWKRAQRQEGGHD